MGDKELYQCPTCGRTQEDWASDDTKKISDKLTKTKQRRDKEDRIVKYRNWRWNFGDGCYVTDVDHVEWRIKNGKITPVAVFELSRVDGNVNVPQTYLDAVLKRFNKRDGQKSAVKRIAELLGVHVYIVLFRWDLTEFWVYDLTARNGWYSNITQNEYEDWIRRF